MIVHNPMITVVCPKCHEPREVQKARAKMMGFTGICAKCARSSLSIQIGMRIVEHRAAKRTQGRG